MHWIAVPSAVSSFWLSIRVSIASSSVFSVSPNTFLASATAARLAASVDSPSAATLSNSCWSDCNAVASGGAVDRVAATLAWSESNISSSAAVAALAVARCAAAASLERTPPWIFWSLIAAMQPVSQVRVSSALLASLMASAAVEIRLVAAVASVAASAARSAALAANSWLLSECFQIFSASFSSWDTSPRLSSALAKPSPAWLRATTAVSLCASATSSCSRICRRVTRISSRNSLE